MSHIPRTLRKSTSAPAPAPAPAPRTPRTATYLGADIPKDPLLSLLSDRTAARQPDPDPDHAHWHLDPPARIMHPGPPTHPDPGSTLVTTHSYAVTRRIADRTLLLPADEHGNITDYTQIYGTPTTTTQPPQPPPTHEQTLHALGYIPYYPPDTPDPLYLPPPPPHPHPEPTSPTPTSTNAHS